MPNPLKERIFGRDFADLGDRRYAWAGFNANIEAQNLARAAAAQDAMDRWALADAQMKREDAMRQATLDANARNTALSVALQREQQDLARRSELEQAARQEKQFGEQMKFAREDLLARGEQAGEKLKLLEEQQKQRIDFNGERFAAQYSIAQSNKSAADKALEDVQSAFDKSEAELMALNAKTKKSEEEITRQSALMAALPKLKTDLRAATTSANRANTIFNGLEARIRAGDYDIDYENGKITHPFGSREWSFAKAVEEAGGNKAPPATNPLAAPTAAKIGTGAGLVGLRAGAEQFMRGVGFPFWGINSQEINTRPPVSAPVRQPAYVPPPVIEPSPLNPSQADVSDYLIKSRYAPNLLSSESMAEPTVVSPDFTPKLALDRATAQAILNEARGDRQLARQIAQERGYTF